MSASPNSMTRKRTKFTITLVGVDRTYTLRTASLMSAITKTDRKAQQWRKQIRKPQKEDSHEAQKDRRGKGR